MGSTENTKLCDFTSHNNDDFICTPIITPATSAPSYEIKPALLNLVMKDQFFEAGDDAALHLNNFVELCNYKWIFLTSLNKNELEKLLKLKNKEEIKVIN